MTFNRGYNYYLGPNYGCLDNYYNQIPIGQNGCVGDYYRQGDGYGYGMVYGYGPGYGSQHEGWRTNCYTPGSNGWGPCGFGGANWYSTGAYGPSCVGGYSGVGIYPYLERDAIVGGAFSDKLATGGGCATGNCGMNFNKVPDYYRRGQY